jgi:DNA-directed RNA polymerase I, II, and III subunit RPABC2
MNTSPKDFPPIQVEGTLHAMADINNDFLGGGGPDDEYVDEVEEEIEGGELIEEQDEFQKAEAADVAKLLRQHPEIWIPYEDQVKSQLQIHAPDTPGKETKAVLRDVSTLDSKHVTYPFLSQYEKTKCISFRASQVEHGAAPYIVVPEGVTDAYQIAKLELAAKRLPYIIKRTLPDGSFEVWRLSDLLIF